MNRHQNSQQEDTVVLVCVPNVTSLQNLGKKVVREKFIFLHEDKHQRFLEADTIVFGGHSQACPQYPKQVFVISRQYLNKEGRHEVDFSHADKPFYKLILSILVSITSHAQSTQNNKFAKSFQYLKKEVGDEVDFVQINIKAFKKLVLTYMMGAARHP